MMKKILTAIPLTISIVLISACNNQDGPAYDPSIAVPHKDSVTQAPVATQPVPTADSTQAVQMNAQPANAQPVATGMNPAHGQPGHRCDIPVGAPLNSPPGKQATPTTQTITPTVTPTAAKTKTAPGMNPPHGEPGHRCDIAVGAPLNSAPTKPATTTVTTATPTPVKTDDKKAAAVNAETATPAPANSAPEKKP